MSQENETVSASAPKLDRNECNRLLSWARAYPRLPAFDAIQALATQLTLALAEIDSTETRVDRAQNDTLRYQRELETANIEVRTLRNEVIGLRAKKPEPTLEPAPKDDPAPVGKKRGRKAKIVPIAPDQAKAQ